MTYAKGWGANKTTREYLNEFDAYSHRAEWVNANSVFKNNTSPATQKAHELFVKFRTLATDDTIEQRERTAKKSVFICVDEILHIPDLKHSEIEFWMEVKLQTKQINEI